MKNLPSSALDWSKVCLSILTYGFIINLSTLLAKVPSDKIPYREL